MTSIPYYDIFNLNLKKGVEEMVIFVNKIKLNSNVFNNAKIVFDKCGELLCFPQAL